MNIVNNAIEAIQDANCKKREIRIYSKKSSPDSLQIIISDTGPGISEKTLDTLFEPFVTTKPEGMGLGLSLSRTIIENHSGQLDVKSKIGSGSCFYILLPIREQCS